MSTRDRGALPDRRLAPLRAHALLAAALLAALCATACKENETNSQTGVAVRITSIQTPIRTTDNFEADASAAVPPGSSPPTFEYNWTRDGNATGNTTQNVSSADTAKGQVWEVTAIARSSGVLLGSAKASVTIANTPPTIGPVRLVPTPPCDDQDVDFTVDSISDVDGDCGTDPFDPNDLCTLSWVWIVGRADGNAMVVDGQNDITPLDESFYRAPDPDFPMNPNAYPGDFVRVLVVPSDDQDSGPARVTPGKLPNGQPRPEAAVVSCPPLTGSGASEPTAPATSATSSSLSLSGSIGASTARAASTPVATDGTREPGEAAREVGEAAARETFADDATQRPLSIGALHVCNLAPDGTIECTGDEATGVTTPPAGAYTQVAVGPDYACAIGDDQTIRCWGMPLEPALLAPPAGDFEQLALASDAACALRRTGEIACWGAEGHALASPPEGVFEYLDVFGAFACAIDADALVSCWGE